MPRNTTSIVLILASAIIGLIAGYMLARHPTVDSPERTSAELYRVGQHIANHHEEVDRAERQLNTMRSTSDSLLRSRWSRRARAVDATRPSVRQPATTGTHRYPGSAETSTNIVHASHASYVLRADDRLIAELVREQRQSDRVRARYSSLLHAYRDQQALMEEQVSLTQRAARRKRRRVIILSAAIATVATLLITGN